MNTSDQLHKHSCRPADYAALIAIDWGDQAHVVATLPAPFCASPELSEITHDPEALTDFVCSLQSHFSGKRIAVALEQRKGALINFLSGFDFIDLYPIEPATAGHFRASFYPSGAKSDPVDAVLLLEILCKHPGRLRRWQPQSAEVRQCVQYCQDRRGLVDQRASHLQRLRSALKLYFPLILQLFDQLDRPIVFAFFKKWPTLHDLQRARPHTIRKFLYAHGSRHEPRIQQRLDLIKAAKPLCGDPGVIEPMVQRVSSLLELIKVSSGEIATYDKIIAELYVTLDQQGIFQSFPGAGEVLAPRLAALFGRDPQRFQGAAELQIITGSAPVTIKSGKSKKVQMRWAGSKFQRQTMTEFAKCSVKFCPWARAFCQLHRPNPDEGESYHTTVRKLAFKWLRILYQCWKQGRPYDEAEYLESLRRSNSPVWFQLQKMQSAQAVS